MNWRRGIFRLWAVASILWVILAVWLKYQETVAIPDPPSGFRIDGGLYDPRFWINTALAPPFIAGVLLLVARWALTGFRKSN